MLKSASISSEISFTLDLIAVSKIVAAFVLNSSDKSDCPAIKASTCSFTSMSFALSSSSFSSSFFASTSSKGISSSGESLPIITIHEKGTSSNKFLILRVKREVVNGAPYYRNYVEKGKFLGDLIGRYASS